MLLKRFVIAVITSIVAVASAYAGDTATLKILGFNEDGKIFAFEEFGVQDGSGFPYANRFYINTETDKFLPDTPIRVRLDDESASVDSAREEAKKQAQSIISDSILNQNTGFTAGWNPVTELSTDPVRIAVNPRPVFPAIDDMLEFRLEEMRFEIAENCALFGESVGYRLLKIGTTADAQTILLHEDSSIPSSRGCPLGYQFAGVQTFFPKEGSAIFAVMIAMRAGGFEGPDHRYLAVTGKL